MYFFLETDSEHVVLRQKNSKYGSKFVSRFAPDNALAAIVACEALNKNALANAMVTQELYEPACAT